MLKNVQILSKMNKIKKMAIQYNRYVVCVTIYSIGDSVVGLLPTNPLSNMISFEKI